MLDNNVSVLQVQKIQRPRKNLGFYEKTYSGCCGTILVFSKGESEFALYKSAYVSMKVFYFTS